MAFNLALMVAVTAAIAFWLSSYRYSRRSGVRAMCMSLALLDVALLIGVLSYSDLGWPLQWAQHLCVMVSAYQLQVFCLHLTKRPERVEVGVRRRRTAVIAACVLLLVFYVLGPLRAGLVAVLSTFGDRPFVTHYLATYTLYLGWAMLDVVLMSRLARHVGRPSLRLGLRLLGAGSLVGLVYALLRLGVSVAVALGAPISSKTWIEYATGQLTFVSIILLMAGILVPPFGARWEARKAHARLEPLWSAVTAVAPELVFGNRGNAADRLRVRITEIRDVLIGPLHSYLDSSVVDRVSRQAADGESSAQQARAVGEAAAIAVALEAKRRAAAPVDTSPVIIGEAPDDEEVAQLVRISTAFAHSPLVTEAVKEFQAQHDPAQ
ncbi:MAB_1171c family putative transporter [Actinosynnema sp. CA-248983]